HSEEEWRKKGFYPVLKADAQGRNTVQRMLELKNQHPLPAGATLPDSFDFSLDRDQQCPRIGDFDDFAKDYPLWGMPYGLPNLPAQEYTTLSRWLENGSPGVAAPQPPAAERARIERWEAFFNAPDNKTQLMARYIYEHLFIASLHFPGGVEEGRFYQLVRSRTAPGEPVEIIATRRPYDAPGDGPVFYRLQPQRTAVLAKRHMPYALNEARMQRWQSLFLEPEYAVTKLPSYDVEVASNPFIAFAQLPQSARYKFMLDEARFTIMGYIKGPVCRGQVALNVIDDHFWVVFMDPDRKSASHSAEFLAAESKNLRLPTGGNAAVSIAEWLLYSRDQLKFLKAKFDYIERATGPGGVRMNLDLIWDGDGTNKNAALTIFRHFDTATVVKGFVGRQPETAWVIDYSLLERIHYLLVAGFDVYGNVGHQLETRLYMDFLRMEGEQNFLFFLPQERRIALRDHWYRGVGDRTKQYVMSDSIAYDHQTDMEYKTDKPEQELLHMLGEKLYRATDTGYEIADPVLAQLQRYTGKALEYMPEVSFLHVINPQRSEQAYSLVLNRGHSNIAQLFLEENRRLPEEDYVSVVHGFIGAYPNQFFQMPEQDLPGFVRAVTSLASEADYKKLVSRYGVRRNAPWFWSLSDRFAQEYQKLRPDEAGLFDLNRYDNR
ncbi:MAG: fatty acid cis/trans isomerase, partial [Halioglobus sp.]|nr:fatty acid cis/trans isomerase [Halioglobus sp.]